MALKDLNSDNMENVNIVLVSPQGLLEGDNVAGVVRSLEKRDEIQRIVFDEAHMLPTLDSFRPPMPLLQHFRKPGSRVPVVLATTTAPDPLLKAFAGATGCDFKR